MSRVFSGAVGDHLDAAYTAITALPFTMCVWFKLTTLLQAQRLVDIGVDSTHRYSLTVSNLNAVVAHHNDGTLSAATETATPASDGGWHVAVATLVGLNSRAAFSDGINKGTNSGTRTLVTPTLIRLGQDLAGVNRLAGLMAHVAIWNGQVSDADIATLATVSPNMVRPDILLDYWPLTSNLASEPSYGSLGTALTVTGTTFSTDNPVLNAGIIQPMYYNRKQMIFI